MISGDSGLTISGAVILKKFVNGFAPAMAEASYRSTGIAFSRPVHSTRKYGYPSHVLTISIIVRASSRSANHAGLMPNDVEDAVDLAEVLVEQAACPGRGSR